MVAFQIALAGMFAILAGVVEGFDSFFTEDHPCADVEGAGVKMDLHGSWLDKNNLGGKGPNDDDEPYLYFANVGNIDGLGLDLRISVLGNEEYKGNTRLNGYRCEGDFASTDCGTGHFGRAMVKLGSETMLKFEILSSDTGEPIVVPAFSFIVADIDKSPGSGEWVGITGYTYAMYGVTQLDQQKQVEFSENVMGLYDFCDRAIEEDKNCLVAKALRNGVGDGSCDNPVEPFEMDWVTCGGTRIWQPSRAFKVDFVHTSSFEVFVKMGGSGILNESRPLQFAFGDSYFDLFCRNPVIHTMVPDDLACEM